jgi:hypothetical protein
MADDGMQIEAPSIDPPAIMGGGAGGGAVKADQMIDTELLEISPEEFGDRQKIGRGSFGEVFRCQVCRLHTAPTSRRPSLYSGCCCHHHLDPPLLPWWRAAVSLWKLGRLTNSGSRMTAVASDHRGCQNSLGPEHEPGGVERVQDGSNHDEQDAPSERRATDGDLLDGSELGHSD